jgi:hypothetical protein
MINLSVTLAGQGATNTQASSGNQLASISSQSFANLLSEAFAETLSKFGIDPSSVQLSVNGTQSQTSGASQNSGSSSGGSLVPSAVAPSSPIAVSPIAVSKTTTPAAAPVAPQTASPRTHWYASDPTDDAYWAKQPAAVQQLREIQDPDQRKQLGAELAAQGYSIDVPIMVWGWDAGVTTQLRKSAGYTWVPSALQQPVSAAPGITGSGITPYDPAKPPAGSIAV